MKVSYKQRIKDLRDLRNIQMANGNWNSSDYMTGLANGLEIALSCFTDKEPKLKTIKR